MQSRYGIGSAQLALTLPRHEGLKGIQKGLSLAYPYTMVMNGTRLGLYEPLKTSISSVTSVSSSSINLPCLFCTLTKLDAFVGAVAGAMSGIIGSTLANPFYIAKTRLQSYSPAFPVGHQHEYAGMVTTAKLVFPILLGAISAMTSIYKSGGTREFFRGTKAACIRISVASPAQLVCYDNAKVHIFFHLIDLPLF